MYGSKVMIFSGIALNYGDTYIIATRYRDSRMAKSRDRNKI